MAGTHKGKPVVDESDVEVVQPQEQMYLMPESLRNALIEFLTAMPMKQVEAGVSALRNLKPIE